MAIKYFNNDSELKNIHAVPNAQFVALGGIKSSANAYDSFKRLVGVTKDGALVAVERKIDYKKFPSLHTCNAKCLNGKHDGACECSCGGKNHGLGMFTKLLEAA
jgi:hypothetical protein